MRVAIVGSGISGLTTAYLLDQQGHEVSVFEKSPTIGGYAGSLFSNGFCIERGPSSFLDNEEATKQLIDRLGLKSQVIAAKPESKRRYVFFDGVLSEIPLSPPSLLRSSFLSWRGKLALFTEPFFCKNLAQANKPGSNNRADSEPSRRNETVFGFAQRHFNSEIADRLVSPMTLGVFGGDAKQLLVSKAFPRMIALEREYGSLLFGMINRVRKGQPPGKIFSFHNGSQTLLDALSNSLTSKIHVNHEILSLSRQGPGWLVKLNAPSVTQSEYFDSVILTGSPSSVAFLLKPHLTPVVYEQIHEATTSPLVTVNLTLKSKTPFRGFGVLVHRNNRLNTLGVLHPPDIFENRGPLQGDQFTLVIGGVFNPQLSTESDSELLKISLTELSRILFQKGDTVLTEEDVVQKHILRHLPGIPQYDKKSAATHSLWSTPESALNQIGLFVNSTFSGGVSLNDCIRKSFELASHFGTEPAP